MITSAETATVLPGVLPSRASSGSAAVHFMSETVEWSTPQEFFDRLNALHNAEAERPAGRKHCDSQQPIKEQNANQ